MATSRGKEAVKNIRFAVIATDVVLFTILEKKLKVLLVPITSSSYPKQMLGFPGGMILPHETADDSVKRHMETKAGVTAPAYMEQLYAFSAVDRDPRGRVVSVAYIAVIPGQKAGMANPRAVWMDVRKLPLLAYDHSAIAFKALERLENKIEYTTIGRHFLPEFFTLTELQQVYEIVLGHTLDKRNFRKKMLVLGLLKATGDMRKAGRSRPAELYRFSKKSDAITSKK